VSPDKPSIAVLPFVNKSGDPEQEYFADGITEDIIIELSRFNSLFIIAPNSSFHYKDQSPNVQDVGSELGVSYVVEGSVRRAGQRVRITTQLVDAGTGSHLWAERYDRDLEDIFAVQDEVVSNIVMMVPGRVEVADRIKSERKPASDISAYDLVLRSNWLTFNEHNPSEALSLLEKAIEIDPSFARAHARLAQHTAWGVFVRGDALETAKRQTREHGKRATRLAPGDAEVHGILAEAYGMVGEHELSAHHADQAISLNPNAYHVMVFVAWAWATLGNTGDAISLFEKAMRTDPYSNIGLRENKVDMYYIARRYDECAAQHIGWPNPPLHTEVAIAAALAQLGREDDAKTMLSRIELELAEGQEIKKICRAYQNMCAKSEDGEHWLEGFRKAGIDI
jgi:TolB-like protein